jgi:hypothetical protein
MEPTNRWRPVPNNKPAGYFLRVSFFTTSAEKAGCYVFKHIGHILNC